MVYVICVTEKCKYARHLFLATIVMTLRFCTCINGHASVSLYNIKCVSLYNIKCVVALLMNQ